ncbi:baseplate hub protein [Achromobacter sp. UBA4530]|uniref:baseplate hub protein n=1 Tax=Achromobacter sp. UBA4530 TaxID=1945912 RepID=UPI00257A4B5C|nr:hypothetical protein [Achromobacter sp. UBA4530]
MSFVKRSIDVTISLGKGALGDEPGPEMTLSGYRVAVETPSNASAESSEVQLSIYGLSLEMMNRLTTVGPNMRERRGMNIIRVMARSGLDVPHLVYEGDITSAWADFGKAPEGVFYVRGQVAGAKECKPVPPRSFPGATVAQDVASKIAASMGYAFEKSGKDVVLANPYFCGTDMDQLRSCALAARISFTIDRGVVSVWHADGFRDGDVLDISPETGLIGYPTFNSTGITFTTLYNPHLCVGKRVHVTSSLQPAQGVWTITSLAHKLEAEVPGGVWQSTVICKRNLDG